MNLQLSKNPSIQEVFAFVYVMLFKQGRASIGGIFAKCMYRSPFTRNGQEVINKCAVGHLIPDRVYDERMEGKGIDQLIEEGLIPDELNWMKHTFMRDLLSDLQSAHDAELATVGFEAWKERMQEIGNNFGVKIPLF